MQLLKYICFLYLFALISFVQSDVRCPEFDPLINSENDEKIYPCHCDANASKITCQNYRHLRFRDVFVKMSSGDADRHFDTFELDASGNLQCFFPLVAHIFGNATFRNVSIQSCGSGRLERHSLRSLQPALEHLKLADVGIGGRDYRNEIAGEKVDFDSIIFAEINTLAHLKTLDLSRNEISHVPDKAFGSLENLLEINLSNNFIAFVGKNAFYFLQKIQSIVLKGNPIKKISNFALFGTAGTGLTIDLRFDGALGPENGSLGPLALASLDRPVKVILGGRQMALHQGAFLLFFLENSNHFVSWLSMSSIDCGCDMYWLWATRYHFADRFLGDPLHCDGNSQKLFWDLKKSDFEHCFELK